MSCSGCNFWKSWYKKFIFVQEQISVSLCPIWALTFEHLDLELHFQHAGKSSKHVGQCLVQRSWGQDHINTTKYIHLQVVCRQTKRWSCLQKFRPTMTHSQLDSLRWFSQRRSRTQVLCTCYIRCDVSSARMALSTFCVMHRDSEKCHIFGGVHPGGGQRPTNSNSAEIFVRCTYPKFHLPVFTLSELSCWQTHPQTNKPTNPHTNKQIPAKTTNVLRYATTLGNYKMSC